MEDPGSASAPLQALINPRVESFERFPIRTRAGMNTQSAWRLAVATDAGHGAIVLVEVAAGETFYRGEGIFLGWTQGQMAAAYMALLPKSEEPPFEIPQLG